MTAGHQFSCPDAVQGWSGWCILLTIWRLLLLQATSNQLSWGEGDQGAQSIIITIEDPGSDNLTESALLIEIADVENADLVEHRASSVITAVSAADLTMSLTPVYNSVVYRWEEAIIPISITSPRLQVPARVSYSLASVTPGNLSYVPATGRSGVIDLDLQPTGLYNLSVPLDWEAIPPQAVDRVTINLNASGNAQVQGLQINGTVLHIFGVEEGQCPPGTARWVTCIMQGMSKT